MIDTLLFVGDLLGLVMSAAVIAVASASARCS